MSSSLIIPVLLIVILAIFTDVTLMRLLKRVVKKNTNRQDIEKEGVFLLDTYSPVLTWLSRWFRFLPKGRKTPPHIETSETHEVSENIEIADQEKPFISIPKITWVEKQGVWLEIMVLILAVWVYCMRILDLGTMNILPGYESMLFQSIDWLLYHALNDFHQFPLWNPYIHTGLPYIADPMLHIYNPLVTIPVLLMGVRDGFKVAIFLSFIMAAIGMWRLGKVFGMGKLPRLWIALMYVFAGQPAARFFQGEYLFVFGFAWIPWIVANLYLFTRKQEKKYFGFSALSIAGLYFCGNAYYPFLMFFVIVIFVLVIITSFQSKKPYVKLDYKLLISMTLIGLLAFGMIAIHFFPQFEFWPRLNKGDDIQGSHTLGQIWLDYTSKDTFRPDAYTLLPAREEYYAYIGYFPFAALVFLPLVYEKKNKRLFLFLWLVLLFVYIWIDIHHMPWRDFFYTTHILSQFRHVLRPLILGSFAIFLLGGMGIDAVWQDLVSFGKSKFILGQKDWGATAAMAGMGLLVVFMAAGIWDVFKTNGQYIKTNEDYETAYEIMHWVRENDKSEYYFRHYPSNAWLLPVLYSKLRYIDAWYPFSDIREYDGQINQRTINARPLYITQEIDEASPNDEGAKLINHIEETAIYHLPESLPIAFGVEHAILQNSDAEELQRSDVTTLTPFFSGTNAVEIIAQGDVNQELVLLVTHYPGWKLTIDGKPVDIDNVGGYMGTMMQNGVHRYRFEFVPIPFFIGLVISLFSLGVGLYLIITDYQLNRRRLVEKWGEFTAGLGELRHRPWIPEAQNQAIVKGVYGDGVFQPDHPVNINNHSQVQLLVVAESENTTVTNLAWRQWKLATWGLTQAVVQVLSMAGVLFILAMGVYVATRLVGLDKFPIYFFTDEAIQTLSAADLVRDGFRDPDGQLLPTYFKNYTYYNLSLSVYVQVIPYLLFGKSIVVTRGVSVLIGILAAFSIAWMLKEIFKLSLWWLGPALLAVVPAWFLHSRTAFETVIFVSFYSACLLSYLLYRYRSPKYIHLTLLMAGLAFYSYSPGQVVTACTGLLLLLSDLGYHWKNRRVIPAAMVTVALIALPYIRFRMTYGDIATEHLKLLASYLTQPIPITEKLRLYATQYFYGISPGYWFIPNQHDLERHLMKDYGLISLYWLPFILAGIGVCIWNFRSSMHRMVIIAMLAAPAGSALVEIGITRALVMVIPATLLMALGLEYCLKWIGIFIVWVKNKYQQARFLDKWRIPQYILPITLFVIFSVIGVSMTRDALINGPTWYRDYGLGGLQYGAPQIFYAINDYLEEHPDAKIHLSPSWANGTDIVARFFLEEDQPVDMASIDGYLFRHLSLDDRSVFVMIPEEYEKTVASEKFEEIIVEKTVPYPDGRIGFYFVRVSYVKSIDEILTTEQEIRRRLQEAHVRWMDQVVKVRYSPLDMGDITLVFDGDADTLARTEEANPAIYEISFNNPIAMDSINLMFGSTEAEVELTLYLSDGGDPVTIKATLYGTVSKPDDTIKFSKTYTVESFQLKLTDTRQGEPGNVHLWDIRIP
ncbi:MAG: glycosyltransferase family 39 protein [Anaerolineales bacterium]|nr:glycosyltransferase family 39 protein [Anaerolineales bacterium]